MIAQVSPGDFCELETHLNYHVYSPFTQKFIRSQRNSSFSIYLQNVQIFDCCIKQKKKINAED